RPRAFGRGRPRRSLRDGGRRRRARLGDPAAPTPPPGRAGAGTAPVSRGSRSRPHLRVRAGAGLGGRARGAPRRRPRAHRLHRNLALAAPGGGGRSRPPHQPRAPDRERRRLPAGARRLPRPGAAEAPVSRWMRIQDFEPDPEPSAKGSEPAEPLHLPRPEDPFVRRSRRTAEVVSAIVHALLLVVVLLTPELLPDSLRHPRRAAPAAKVEKVPIT